MSGYLPAIGAREIEPLEMVDRALRAAVETREGPDDLRRAIWRDDSGAELWVHLQGEAPHTSTVIFRGTGRVTGRLAGISTPKDGPLNGLVLIDQPEPALAPHLVLDLAEYGDAAPSVCVGRKVTVGIAALLTDGRIFADRAAYLSACTRRGGDAPAVPLSPVGLRPQGDTPQANLGGTISAVEERRNSLSGESFLALTVEWEDHALEVAANAADLDGEVPAPGRYLTGRVWIVGFDLSYTTVVDADPTAFPLPAGTVAAFSGWNGYLQLLQVTAVESVGPGNPVVHLRVFAELFESLDALQAHQGERQVAVTHLPIDAGALLDSNLAPLGPGPLTAVDEQAYTTWQEAFERGEAGVFGIPLDQVMNFLSQNQPDEEETGDDLMS